MGQVIVGMADMKVVSGMEELVTYALGSCVGICMYDDVLLLGGMLHAMLPVADSQNVMFQMNRYVDTGIPHLYQALCRRGADKKRLKVKLIGGAKMFDFAMADEKTNIGSSNILVAKKCLYQLDIPVVAEMTGGEVGRTVYFTAGTGEVRIKTTDNEEFLI